MRHVVNGLFVGLGLILAANSWAQQRPASYSDFNTSVPSTNGGAALTALIEGGTTPYIYIQPGVYVLNNPVRKGWVKD